LREAGLIDHAGQGYCLTEAGVALRIALRPLTDWAETWCK
jgi:DNA-binding HxlR family transcriptional regulator